MADEIYQETREGQTPSVQGTGGGSLLVDWQQPKSEFSNSSQILSGILTTLEQEDEKKRKKQAERFDMYKTLRENGYDTRAAFEAMQSGNLPNQLPNETTKEQKDKLDLEKTQQDIAKSKADTKLAEEKAAAYARGDIGRQKSNAEKMNAAQLQREIKRVSDPFENPDYDSEETKSYLSYLNSRLQQMSQYPGSQPSPIQTDAPEQPASKSATGKKIKVRRKSDGQIGSISEKFFDPKKYERA